MLLGVTGEPGSVVRHQQPQSTSEPRPCSENLAQVVARAKEEIARVAGTEPARVRVVVEV